MVDTAGVEPLMPNQEKGGYLLLKRNMAICPEK